MTVVIIVHEEKIEAVDTGCKLPQGAQVVPSAACERCDSPPRDLCFMKIAGPGGRAPREYRACAECLADFVSSGMVRVYVRDATGNWWGVEREQVKHEG